MPAADVCPMLICRACEGTANLCRSPANTLLAKTWQTRGLECFGPNRRMGQKPGLLPPWQRSRRGWGSLAADETARVPNPES